jgi:hypothetical protein
MLTVTVCVNLPRSIVTDHYLLDHHTGGKPGQWDDGPANNYLLVQAYGCIHIDPRDLWVCLVLLIIATLE